jgi:hypothetical protein
MAVGIVGVFATLGLLLFTLKVVDQKNSRHKAVTISQLTFQSLLRQGEVVECTLENGRLRGLRRVDGDSTERFVVDGEVPSRLLREISRHGVPVKRPEVKVVRESVPITPPGTTKRAEPKKK